MRGPDGRVERIVEQTDASPEELEIREGNTGVYLVDSELLRSALAELDTANAQAELYLTDVIAIARVRRLAVEALRLDDADEALGVNNRAELARATRCSTAATSSGLGLGVTFIDPASVWIDTDVEIGADSQIDPGVVITGPSRLGEGVHVKAHTVIESSVLEDDVVIGPSAHLRPGRGWGAVSASGTSSRSRTATSGRARRPITSPTSATPTSAPARPSAAARSR